MDGPPVDEHRGEEPERLEAAARLVNEGAEADVVRVGPAAAEKAAKATKAAAAKSTKAAATRGNGAKAPAAAKRASTAMASPPATATAGSARIWRRPVSLLLLQHFRQAFKRPVLGSRSSVRTYRMPMSVLIQFEG